MAYRISVNFAIGINILNIVYASQTLMDVGHTDLKYTQHHPPNEYQVNFISELYILFSAKSLFKKEI